MLTSRARPADSRGAGPADNGFTLHQGGSEVHAARVP